MNKPKNPPFRLSPTQQADIIIFDKKKGLGGMATTRGTYRNLTELKNNLKLHFIGMLPHRILVRIEQGDKQTSFNMLVGDRKKRKSTPKKVDGLLLKPTKKQLQLLEGYMQYRKGHKKLANWNPTQVLFTALEEMVENMPTKAKEFISQFVK